MTGCGNRRAGAHDRARAGRADTQLRLAVARAVTILRATAAAVGTDAIGVAVPTRKAL